MIARYLALAGISLLAVLGPDAGAGRAETPPATAAGGVAAQRMAHALADVIALGELAEVMRLEGLRQAAEIGRELLPGGGGAAWLAEAGRLYDAVQLRAAVVAALAEAIGEKPGALAPARDFFASDFGQRIVALEIGARRVLLDDATEATLRERVAAMEAAGDPRLAAVRRFMAVNDLVEFNVAGGLNAHYAFYSGLIEGGAFEGGVSEAEILADVWSQEETLREENVAWLESFLVLAYGPLEDAELEAYIAFSASEAGQQLNRALAAAFDRTFVTLSRGLGLAAARHLRGEEL